MKKQRIHFCGIAGSGLSALARLTRWRGARVSGSDRDFDRGRQIALQNSLEDAGIIVVPQNGSGSAGAAKVVASAAVEKQIPDLREACLMGVPVIPRFQYLRELGEGFCRVAIAGTNGKSSTTAILAWILNGAGLDPTVVLGADIRGDWGGVANARAGKSEIFCFEADESDGGLENYQPRIGLITNISPDHFSLSRLQDIFRSFADSVTETLIVGTDIPESHILLKNRTNVITFSFNDPADLVPSSLKISSSQSEFCLDGSRFLLPVPGRHNIANAVGALAVARTLGVSFEASAEILREYRGLARRFEIVGEAKGIKVIDDYAHNPAKIKAALSAGRLQAQRLIVLYRPHGFGPLRNFLTEYAESFKQGLRPDDCLVLLPVYYAGGTAPKDISSQDLARELTPHIRVRQASSREDGIAIVKNEVASNTAVMVMGARDPDLSGVALEILKCLEGGSE